MSLQTLLAQYPNFSARRIRRLAIQLQFLEKLNSPEAKGIASDLMALTMQAAKTETQLSDVSDPNSEQIKFVNVVTSAAAIQAVDEFSLALSACKSVTEAHRCAQAFVQGASFSVQDPRIEVERA